MLLLLLPVLTQKKSKNCKKKKMLSGKDFLIKDLSENLLEALRKYFSKYMIASSLELATDIIPEGDRKDPGKIKKLTTEISNSKVEMLEKML